MAAERPAGALARNCTPPSTASVADRAVNQIWQESGSYYLLGYRPPTNDHRLHKIEVKVNVPNAAVRARRARG
jgi:hypothetical protein